MINYMLSFHAPGRRSAERSSCSTLLGHRYLYLYLYTYTYAYAYAYTYTYTYTLYLYLYLRGHRGRVLGAAFSPDAELLLTAGHDGGVRLWDIRRRRNLCVYAHQGGDPVWALDWSPVGHYFVSSGAGGEGLLWSLERSSPLRAFAAPDCLGVACWPGVQVAAVHPSARYAALAGEEGMVLYIGMLLSFHQLVSETKLELQNMSCQRGGASMSFWEFEVYCYLYV